MKLSARNQLKGTVLSLWFYFFFRRYYRRDDASSPLALSSR